MKKILKAYKLVLLALTIISIMSFIVGIIMDANKKAIVLFNLVNSSIALIVLLFTLLLFFIYIILLGIYKKKIFISLLSLLLIYPIILVYVIFGFTIVKCAYKVEINELNEKLMITDYADLHGSYNILYEKEFLFIYNEIETFGDTYIGEKGGTKFSVEEDKLIIEYEYHNMSSKEILILYYDYENKTFYIK